MITEVGKKWLEDRFPEAFKALGKGRYEVEEFWLRAFCDEVEKRAKQMALANSHGIPHDPNFTDYSEAFEDLRRELLG